MAGSALDSDATQALAIELLRNVGQRVTRPRVTVLGQVLAAGDAHLSADELLERVSATGEAAAHRATVYRTLEGLTEAGVLCHVHLDRGLTAYHLAASTDGRGSGHLHAQCVQCGKVVDLPPTILSDAADRIHRSAGFVLDPAHVALSGTCKECAHKPAGLRATRSD